MGAAIALASRGQGRTFPNPNVGCVIVADGRVIGRGWTQPGGRPHAEAMALAEAGDSARGATLYVSLEPCAHSSERGPTCSRLIAEAGLSRVVVAVGDPDPRTDGAGLAILRSGGVDVVEGVREIEARRAMAGFLTRQTLGRPHVTLKLAMSLDGKIARADGQSRWITGEDARAHGHLERSRAGAIVVGRGTFEADSPKLDVRLPGLEDRSPAHAMLTRGDVPEGWTGLFNPQDVKQLNTDHILVEGGSATAASFLAADLVDRLLIYRAPILIGDGKAALGDIGLATLADAHNRWRSVDSRMLGQDRLDIYERVRESG